MTDLAERLPEKVIHVHNILLNEYGEPTWRPHLDAVSELVSTILSQNTNDVNRDVAFDRLRALFPKWEQVRDAQPEAVVEAIRQAGLANQKGPRIQQALQRISHERGQLDLDFLAEWPVEQAKEWLTSINGVGPKTAAIVLLFALGRPAFPVDTHVHRVAGRLGLIGPSVSRERAHAELEQLIPERLYYPFHLNLIRHGRRVCSSRKPKCNECPLRHLCPSSEAQAP